MLEDIEADVALWFSVTICKRQFLIHVVIQDGPKIIYLVFVIINFELFRCFIDTLGDEIY